MSQYLRERWGTEEGLAGFPINALAQTPDGYLWLGTDRGLLRFDGRVFSAATPSEQGVAPYEHVLALIVDTRGTMWIRFQGTRIVKYTSGRFEEVFPDLDRENGVTAMGAALGGGVILSTLLHGTMLSVGMQLERIVPAERSLVLSVAQGSDGRLWLGTRDMGLLFVDHKRTHSVGATFPEKKINALLPDENGQLWVGTDDGLAKWDGKRMAKVTLPSNLNHLQVLSILKDRLGNLWLGTSEGLVRYNVEGASLLQTGSLDGAAVTAVLEDRDGDIWFGDKNSLQQIRQGAFISFSKQEGLPGSTFGPIAIDKSQRIWSAPMQGGLFWFRDDEVQKVTVDGLNSAVVYSIQASDDGVWIGRQGGGLTHIESSGRVTSRATTYTQRNGLAENNVYALHVSRDQSVWAGTLTSGVSHLDHGKFRTYKVIDGLASNQITAIEEGAPGVMWFGGPNGLSSLSGEGWRRFATEEGLPSPYINCLVHDKLDVLWIGTASGLAYFAHGKIGIVKSKLPLLDQPILGISEDEHGYLWIAAEHGIFRLSANIALTQDVSSDQLIQYGISDGLRGSGGVRRDHAVSVDSLGNIWFSLSKGLSRVNPESLEQHYLAAIPQIQSVLFDGASHTGNKLLIPPNTSRVVFTYNGLSFANVDRLRFRYRLDDYDHGWNGPVTDREAVYTNLAPGHYRFRLMTAITPGRWGNQESEVQFTVVPSFQQTWYFKTVLVVATGLLAWLIYLFRTRQLISRAQALFHERTSERERIARDLHDTLLQSIVGVSLYLQFASDQLKSRQASNIDFETALQRIDAVVDEGRRSVQGLRLLDLDDATLEQILREKYRQLPGSERVTFLWDIKGEPVLLQPVLFEEICFIVQEALLNSLRHANAARMGITIEYSVKCLIIEVWDDGCGVDSSLLAHGKRNHFGLRGMRERAAIVGGELIWERVVTGGTRVTLAIPARKAYFQKSWPKFLKWFSKSHQ